MKYLLTLLKYLCKLRIISTKKRNFMEFELWLANDLHGVHKPSFGEENLKTYKSCAGRKPSYKNKRNF
jgi:hypothetical protein